MNSCHDCSIWLTCLTRPPRQSALAVGRRRACSSLRPCTVWRRNPRCLARVSRKSARSPLGASLVMVPACASKPVTYRPALGAPMARRCGLPLAEAERVPGRIEEHAEGRAGLVIRLGGTDGQHPALSLVEIGNVEVEVDLLGHVLVGPGRGPVTVDALERQRPLAARVELDPRVVGTVVERPAAQLAVE